MPKKLSKVDELKSQIADLTNALQHERADAINIRRRHAEQMAEMKATMKVYVVSEILPAIDNLERALLHIPKDLANHDYIKGISGVIKQFEKVFSDLGVKRIKSVGEPFNPLFHEAVSVEGDGNKEVIIEELQSGYTLGDQVIRHAMVKVKKK